MLLSYFYIRVVIGPFSYRDISRIFGKSLLIYVQFRRAVGE